MENKINIQMAEGQSEITIREGVIDEQLEQIRETAPAIAIIEV